jgi:hypothetical protein
MEDERENEEVYDKGYNNGDMECKNNDGWRM